MSLQPNASNLSRKSGEKVEAPTPIKQDGGGLATLHLKGPSSSDDRWPQDGKEKHFVDGEMKIGYWNLEGLATSG